jgi:phosphatidylglycerol:prolipoprotein diacylglycerol transferase
MIAFTIFWRPIYWYGIFYLITFFCGYQFLLYLWKTKRFAQCKWLQSLLTDKIDDLVFVALLWVILWGRLGHVLLYEFSYYLTHPSEILSIWQWGMSFIGGVIGVVIGLIYLTKKISLSKTELFLLGDIILCVVPIWSMLWRIGNFLNQELWWLPVDNLPTTVQSIIKSVWLEYVYTSVDDQVRVNTNFFQSFLEWFVILCVTWAVMFGMYIKKHIRPGMITWLFFVLYGIFRFIAEFLKDLPVSEMKGVFSVSQRVMIGFILIWSYFLMQSKKNVQ